MIFSGMSNQRRRTVREEERAGEEEDDGEAMGRKVSLPFPAESDRKIDDDNDEFAKESRFADLEDASRMTWRRLAKGWRMRGADGVLDLDDGVVDGESEIDARGS